MASAPRNTLGSIPKRSSVASSFSGRVSNETVLAKPDVGDTTRRKCPSCEATAGPKSALSAATISLKSVCAGSAPAQSTVAAGLLSKRIRTFDRTLRSTPPPQSLMLTAEPERASRPTTNVSTDPNSRSLASCAAGCLESNAAAKPGGRRRESQALTDMRGYRDPDPVVNRLFDFCDSRCCWIVRRAVDLSEVLSVNQQTEITRVAQVYFARLDRPSLSPGLM